MWNLVHQWFLFIWITWFVLRPCLITFKGETLRKFHNKRRWRKHCWLEFGHVYLLVGWCLGHPPWELKTRGSIPVFSMGIFLGWVILVTKKLAPQWLSFQGAGVYVVSAVTGWLVSVYCDWMRYKGWSAISQCGSSWIFLSRSVPGIH